MKDSGNRSVSILFGGIRPVVNGGTKVVLEYANRLVERGWDVRLVFAMNGYDGKNIFKRIYCLLSLLKSLVMYGRSVRNWFNLDSRVKELFVSKLDYKKVPSSDVYIATYVSTAPLLNKYPIEAKRKFYLIQDYEIWEKGWSEDKTRQTYHYDMTKFVISGWLKDLLKGEGVESIKIPNGFNFDYFKKTIPIEQKDKYCITVLYNKNPHKGVEFSLAAVRSVKINYPQLKVKLFGTYKSRPEELDDWMEYYSNPNQELHNKLYNESSIYVAASTYEGWGLTIGEAMICGCAIACTDTEGFKEMVVDGKTGLLSPVRDVEALSQNIMTLIEDDELRISIASAGNESIAKFTWDNSVNILEKTLEEGVKRNSL